MLQCVPLWALPYTLGLLFRKVNPSILPFRFRCSYCGLGNISVLCLRQTGSMHVSLTGVSRLSDVQIDLHHKYADPHSSTRLSAQCNRQIPAQPCWSTGLCGPDSTNSDTQTKQAVAKQPKPLIWHPEQINWQLRSQWNIVVHKYVYIYIYIISYNYICIDILRVQML